MADSHQLHAAAMLAFKRAKEAFKLELRHGTPEWDHWQSLFKEAMNTNRAYVQSIRQPPVSSGQAELN